MRLMRVFILFAVCINCLFFSREVLGQKTCLVFPGMSFTDSLNHDQPINAGVSNALEKARLVAGIEWAPRSAMPSVYGIPYQSQENRLGVPYSLAQKVNGYVGLDVSFYTFLTAIHNPRSVMYTENLSMFPYYGFDAAPYYGSVCSTSVWYALGIPAPYYTSSINANDALTRRDDLPADSVQLCDVLWKTGHVAMVYDIARDEYGYIQKVVVFETTTNLRLDSKLVEYSYDGFIDRWNGGGYVIYRPKNLSSNNYPDEPFEWVNGHLTPQFVYNDDVCTNHGDRVSYPVGDSVVINVLSKVYSELELYKDDSLYISVPLECFDMVFYDLPYGSYKARLVEEDHASDYTYFEIIDISVSYNVGNQLTVYFSSANAIPEFMSLGDERECPYYCTIFTPT